MPIMLLGRDTPGKKQRAEWAREFFATRSNYAIVAGLLGVFAPVDGAIFPLFSLAAITLGIIGLTHIKRQPELLGKRLCFLGMVGGVIGTSIFVVLQVM